MPTYCTATIKNLKYPAGSNRGLRLGRTWHVSDLPANEAPETRHACAHAGTEKSGSDKGGNRGSRGAAPHKHTHQKTHESRQHTRRAASFTAFLSPLLIPRRLYSQGWLCRSADVPCAVDVHVDVDVDVDGQSTGSDLHNHRQRSKTQHRINTQKARIRQMGFGRWV